MSIKVVDSSNFESEIKGATNPVIVDFYADWCGPCKMIAPILEEISETEDVTVLKVNVDASNDLAQQYGVVNIPTMITFVNGEMHKKHVGALPKDQILELAK